MKAPEGALYSKREYFLIVIILGSLTTVSPFSIDMYLPAFPILAEDLNTSVGNIQLSLTSYFVGIAFGQLVYGPLLDRYGRKNPLFIGMGIYVLASIGCIFAGTAEKLILIRLLQALGGCASMVAARAMVRDHFHVSETAKVFSTLMLVIAVSPMIAPTLGGYITAELGWRWVFVALALIGLLITASARYLPKAKEADSTFSLRPKKLAQNYWKILCNPSFYIYALIGGISSASLFAYVSASPDIFMNVYAVGEKEYGWIFAIIAIGLIGSAQVNRVALNHFKIELIIITALICQIVIGVLMIVGVLNDWFNAPTMAAMIFLFLSGFGFTNPNAAALSLAPFTREAGSASALMGAIQMTMGVLASLVVSIWHDGSAFPMASVMLISAMISLFFMLYRKIA